MLHTIVIPLSTVLTRISAAVLINPPENAALIRVMTVIGNLRVYYIWGKLLLHLGQNVITFRTLFKSLLHLGQNVITFRALLHLKLYYISGRLLHLGLLYSFVF